MPRKALALHNLKGLRGISCEDSEARTFRVLSGEGTWDELQEFYGSSAPYALLHTWLLSINKVDSGRVSFPATVLGQFQKSLAIALAELASGNQPDFLTAKKSAGPKDQGKMLRYAVAAAAACYAAERILGNHASIQRWWNALCRKRRCSLPTNLASHISNVAGQEGVSVDKRLLLAAHAFFLEDVPPAKHKMRVQVVQELVEELLNLSKNA